MKVIIIGIGKMGKGLSINLIKKGHQVTVIDSDQKSLDSLGTDFTGEKILGFGFDRDILLQAKIDRVDAVVSCTTSDEINAVIARIARNIYRVPHVIARLYDPGKAEIYRRLGIQTISTTMWGIERASELLTYNQLDSIYEIGNGTVNLIRIEVPSLLVGYTVKDITVIGEITVTAISRHNKTFIPTMGTIFEAEDVLYITVSISATAKLKSIIGLV